MQVNPRPAAGPCWPGKPPRPADQARPRQRRRGGAAGRGSRPWARAAAVYMPQALFEFCARKSSTSHVKRTQARFFKACGAGPTAHRKGWACPWGRDLQYVLWGAAPGLYFWYLHSTNFNGNEASCGPAGLVAALLRPCASHSRCSVISARLVGTPTTPQPAFAPSALHGNVAWCEGVPASQRRFRPGKPRNYLGYRRCQAGDAMLGL